MSVSFVPNDLHAEELGKLLLEIPRTVLDSKDSGTNQDEHFHVDELYTTGWKELAYWYSSTHLGNRSDPSYSK